jgi:dipeptide transport system substrate-binding protein
VLDIGINVTFGPLKDKRVRQAIAWSMDRARLCKTILQGLAEPTCLIWPRHSWAYFPDLEGKIGYDLEKAKALLREAGQDKGFDVELLTSSRETPSFGPFASILQADLKKIGVNGRITDTDAALYNTRSAKGDIEIIIHQYGRANRDPGTTVTGAKAWFLGKEGNWTHYESEEWPRLRAEMQSTMDREKRKAAARKLQELALDECFTIVVADSPQPWAYASHVKDFNYDLNGAPFSSGIWLGK